MQLCRVKSDIFYNSQIFQDKENNLMTLGDLRSFVAPVDIVTFDLDIIFDIACFNKIIFNTL